jgi:2Fe-2S ferredoxin
MPVVRFVESDGTAHIVDAAVGQTLKQAAIDNLVPGIIGECGGCATCGTCHGYVDARFLPLLAAPDDNEQMVLEGVPAPLAANSRLTCQILMTEELAGIEIHLPVTQY